MRIFDEGKATLKNVDITMQCLRMTVPSTIKFGDRAHYHEYIELLYGINCDCEIWIDGAIYPFKSGDLIVVNSMEAHDFRYFRKENDYIVVKFSPQQIYTSQQSLYEMKYLLPFTLNEFSANRRIEAEKLKGSYVEASFNTIMEEWESKAYGYELGMRSHILLIVLWMLRYWNKTNPELLTNINLSPILARALNYISLNLAEITANDVADFCGYSYTYFSEMFKNSMHMTFREYLLKARINESEKLLLTTQMGVTEIAMTVGFSTASHFIKQFKTAKGCTPAQYRLNAKKGVL